MNQQEKKNVIQYLYSIKRTQLAILNLERALEELKTRRESPPVWMHNPDAVSVTGGVEGSKQEAWVEFLEAYPARKSFLEDQLSQKVNKVEQFDSIMAAMPQEGHWGSLAVEIIRHKYIQRISPDKAIYSMFLFCSEETYYRTHRKALQYFVDVLPQTIKNDSLVTVNKAKKAV